MGRSPVGYVEASSTTKHESSPVKQPPSDFCLTARIDLQFLQAAEDAFPSPQPGCFSTGQ